MLRWNSVTLLTLTALTVGCRGGGLKDGSLEGVWEGVISCGSGGVSLVFDVEPGEESDEYDAEGLISGLSLDGEPSDVELDGIWVQPEAAGPQVIEVSTSCTVVQSGGTFEIPCDGFDELGWDGVNTLEAGISNFLDSGLDCDLTLTRG
jgi:hypothetical protein